MKTKFYTLFSFVIIIAVLVSCKSATKLYQKGNYDEAVLVAAKKLQKDPNDAKLKSVLKDAYRYALEDHQSRISSFSEMNDELKWEKIYYEYQSLQNLYAAIFKAPSVYEVVNPQNFSDDLHAYADKAADVRYGRGLKWMELGDKKSYKRAYSEFHSALYFKPGDVNIQKMLDEAFDAALTRVVIMPVDNYGYRFSSYRSDFQSIDDDLLRNLRYNAGNQFVKFYSTWEADRENIIADEIVELRFSQFDIGSLRENRNSREVSKQVVVREIVYRPDSIVKEYATVRAQIITTTRRVESEGNLNILVRDRNGRWLWNDMLRTGHNWATTYTSFTGDERALSEEDKKQLTPKMEAPPSEYDILHCLKQNISGSLPERLRNYYSRY